MAFDPLSPEVTYALKQNIKYPGSSSQATAAEAAAISRMQDAYTGTTITFASNPIVPAT